LRLALAGFGLLAIYVGGGAAFLAFKDGEIARLMLKGYQTACSRDQSPFLFWSGIAVYSLIALARVVGIIGAIFGS